ncbi:MAG TPA: cytochrome C [Verrucomicrobiae bacterium]
MIIIAQRLIGPRAPMGETRLDPLRYRLPAWLLSAAAALLLVSLFLPYWQITMFAPQYPGGLTVTTYVNHVGGRLQEVDILNQYIGMKPLESAAVLEKRFGVFLIVAMALLVLAAVKIHSPFAAFLSVPALLYPIIFLADLQFWLADFGLHLDPHAPLNMAVKPFVPHVLGVGYIGQFKSVATPCSGLILAFLATALVLAGLWLQRRAYKPLRDNSNPGYAGDSK